MAAKSGFTRGCARRCAAATTLAFAGVLAASAANATLSVTPLTWNVIGLDSNSPATGPQHFPVGARVCSTTAAANVSVQLVFDSANPYINARPGSQSTLTLPAIAASACEDAYFEVEVTRDPAAFDTVRRYHVTASDGVDTASTPVLRELYVEHLISQSRNSITGIKVDGVSIPAGGSVGMVVGNTYTIELDGGTATQGYNQFESFINLSNAIFRIDSVATTYSADNSPYVPGPAPAVNDKLYADACKWENNPGSPNYRSCVGGDFKAGGSSVVTIYTITIVGGGGTSQTLSTLLYDFSGSSFHYNADFATHGVITNIIDPAALGFTKQFAPAATTPGGTSTLTFTIGNPNAAAVSGAGFADNLPGTGGGQMVVASPATFSAIGCGTPTFAPTAGATTISVSNATIPANGTCTLSVKVSVPNAPASGTYVNTSGNLIVAGLDTGRTATANLALSATAPPTNLCGLTLAQWTMEPAAGTAVPPAFSLKAADVASAVASIGSGISTSIDTGIGNPVNAWAANGFDTGTTLNVANNDYFQFAVDTSKYTSITFAFDARLANQTHGPQSLQLFSSTDGVTFTPYSGVLSTGPAFANFAPAVTGANAGGVTYFRIYGWNSANSGNSALIYIDNIKVGGCQTASPPTLAKGFAPSTVAVGGTSTLTFTLTNPNTAPVTGVAFNDSLPAGMQVASSSSSSTTCGGTWAPAGGASSLAFTGGTIAASGSCTVSVNVTVATPGTHTNVSGFVSSAEGGTNATATGSATATLQALVPPSIAAAFAPASVLVNANSVLTFTLTNPNAAVALSAVSFSDAYPANLLNANPPVPAVTNTCGGTLTATPGGSGVTLSGGAIAAAGTCTISVPVTSASAGTYDTTTGAITDASAGTGNTASAQLIVTAPAPASSLLKQIGTSATGPWFSFVAVAPGTPLYYRFTVENTGDVPLDPFGVSDPTLPQAGSCAWQTPNSPSTLPVLPVASATLDPTATCVVGPVFATLGAGSNTATAQGTFAGNAVTSVPSTADYVGALPGFTLVKEVATSPLGPWASAIGVASGGEVFYRFTLVNTGGLALSGIGVTDPMVDLSTCTFTDPLVVGDATTCTAGPVVASGSPGAIVTNTAIGHGANGGSVDTPPATASYTISTANADLAIAKSNGVGSVAAGGSTTYTITVSNNGPDGVTDATVTDNAPAGMTFGAWTCVVSDPGSGGGVVTACAFPGGIGNLSTTVTLQPGAVVTYTLAASVDSAASGTIANTASVAAPVGVFDAVSANDSATDSDAVDVVSDLAIVVDDGVPMVLSGTTTTYTITVTNMGPATSVGAVLADPAAPGLAKLSVVCGPTPSQCTVPPTVAALEGGSFALPALAPGATYQVQVAAQVTAGSGSVTNVALVAPPFGSSDPNPANNAASDTDVVMPAPVFADLAVTVSDGMSSATAGGPLTYTITVTNSGPNGVTGANVVNAFPPNLNGVVWVCSGTGGGTCLPGGAGDINTNVDLPVGAQVTFTATGTLDPSSSGVLTDTANVSSGVIDPVPGNNSATDVDTVIALPPPAANDLAITIDDGIASIAAGATTAYTITVSNNGLSTITGAVLADPAAAGLVKTAVACAAVPGQCVTAPTIAELDSGTFALPALAPGATYVLVVTAQVNATGGVVTSMATIAMPGGITDDVPANNVASDTDTVTPPPPGSVDVSVTVDDGVTSVTQGSVVTYTITVANSGPQDALAVDVTDVFPPALGSVTWTCAGTLGGLCPEEPGSGDIAATVNLPAGSLVVFTATGTLSPSATGALVDAASATVPASYVDTNAANNSAADTDTIVPAVALTDLGVTVDDGVASLISGTPTNYVVTVTNNGPSPVTGAILADPVAAGLAKTAVACAPVPGECVTPPTIVELESGTFALPALGVGQSYAIVVTANVIAPSGSVSNSAAVAAPTGVMDTNAANDSAIDTDPVAAAPVNDLAISVDDGVSTVMSGTTTTYTVVVANNGSTTITGAMLTDPAAPGMTKTTVTCAVAPGQCAAPPTVAELESGTFALPALAPGETYALSVSATVNAASGSVVDTATIAMPVGTTDAVPADNVASDTDTVLPAPPIVADLAIIDTNSVASLMPGANVTYLLVVTNNGPASVRGAVLSDPAPAGIARLSVACTSPGVCVTAPSVAALEGGFALPTLGPGESYELLVTGTVSAASGSTVTDAASVNVPLGVVDPAPSNNAASDSDPVVAAPVSVDLAISVTASAASVAPGGSFSYTVTVTNNGPTDVANALVTDAAPPGVTFGAWNCTVVAAGSGGSVTTACGAPSGSGNLASTVTMQPGAVIRFVIAASVAPGASGNLVDSASVNAPAGVTEANTANNVSTTLVSVRAARAAATEPIPTLSEWGLLLLSLLMFGAAAWGMRRGVRQR